MRNGREPAERAMVDEKSIVNGRRMFRKQCEIARPPPASRANLNPRLLTWGSAALHPRLYAVVRFAD